MNQFKLPASGVPKLHGFDATLQLLREGYPFIHSRRQVLGSDAFIGRVLGRESVFIGGPEATELFYDEKRFERSSAIPTTVKRSLFGIGGVQELDDEAHKERKALFMSLMTGVQFERLLQFMAQSWSQALTRRAERKVVVFDESARVLCRGVCAWLGIPLSVEAHVQLTHDCVHMVDGFASAGVRLFRAIQARKSAERWARGVITDVRLGTLPAEAGSPVAHIANFRSAKGELPVQIAAVELLNIVRPTVAIAWWVSFAALAMHKHPAYTRRLREDISFSEPFAQEVRRMYPFTPYLGARARFTFEWNGVRFKAGQLVLLDVYGALHDPRLWEQPEAFRPERFIDRPIGKFDFIPNGGGEFTGHRCAGEWLVKECLQQAVVFLSRDVVYTVPIQDLDYRLSRIPTRPSTGVILEDVEATHVAKLSTEPVTDPYSALVYSPL